MVTLPTVVTSSVIRSAEKGESHGGVYIVDLKKGESVKVLDWDKADIDWEGRGADRGLRGIELYNGKIFLAASDELFLFDKSWSIINSYTNDYLKHCHEITRVGNMLLLTSTGYDSILSFNLDNKEFIKGYHFFMDRFQIKRNLMSLKINKFINRNGKKIRAGKILPRPIPKVRKFNPRKEDGPSRGDNLHINNVEVDNKHSGFFVSGTKIGHLLYCNENKVSSYMRIPYLTHNAKPFKGGTIANNTYADGISFFSSESTRERNFEIIKYSENELENNDIPDDHARQAFGRGLVATEEGLVVGGSSPATISVYDFKSAKRFKTVNITMDIRNSIHGLELWPYGLRYDQQ